MHHRRIGVVLGDGQMAAQCAKLVAERDDFVLSTVIHHEAGHQWSSDIQKISNKFHIPHLVVGNVNDVEATGTLQEIHPDIVFSINNWDVIGAELLQIPGDGIINFHNGPLPDYRGVNAPSWAIINRERRYGVTWHFVERKIDAGDIVASESFELDSRETAISLTFRCMRTGMRLFQPLLKRYASGSLVGWPQKGGGRYFSTRDSPPNNGFLDFNLEFEQLSALVRGLTFRPFENPFAWPKIRVGRHTLLVSEISLEADRREDESWTCGEIRKIDDHGVVVCARDSLVRVSGLMEEDLHELTVAELSRLQGLQVGGVLARTIHESPR